MGFIKGFCEKFLILKRVYFQIDMDLLIGIKPVGIPLGIVEKAVSTSFGPPWI
jgi:hypothetical protein